MDGELHAGLLGQREAVGQAGVVWAEAQQARHQRTVGAVAPACGGKAAVESNVRLGGDVAQQLLSRISNAGCTRRMAGGGADHHRPENVEQTHEVYTSFRFAAPGTPFADKRTDFLSFYYTAFELIVL